MFVSLYTYMLIYIYIYTGVLVDNCAWSDPKIFEPVTSFEIVQSQSKLPG